MFSEAKLTNLLAITAPLAPAAGNTAAANGDASASADPLGAFGALLSQLLGAQQPAPEAGIVPAAIAALNASAKAGATPADAATGSDLLKTITDALAGLDAALADGEKVDPALIEKLNDAAEALAAAIGVTLPTTLPIAATPTPSADATAPATPASDASPLSALVAKLADLGQTLKTEAPELAAKLATLAGALDKTFASTIPAEILQKLGLEANGAASPQLAQAIKALVDAKPAVPTTPQLSANVTLAQPKTADTAKTTDQPTDQQATSAKPDPTLAAPTATAAKPTAPADKPADGPKLKLDATATASAADTTADDAPAKATAANATLPVQPAQLPQTAAARAVQIAYTAAANGNAVPQFAFEMARQYSQGQSRFTIRLDPPELGRVDVKMHIDSAGNINARLTVERSETLDMFQRDQRSLERALQQAGLDSSKTNLEFSLKQNPFAQMAGGDGRNPRNSDGSSAPRIAMDDEPASLPSITLYRGTASAGGVNLFV